MFGRIAIHPYLKREGVGDEGKGISKKDM